MVNLDSNQISRISSFVTKRDSGFLSKFLLDNQSVIKEKINNKSLLIFGASGFIGRETVLKSLEYNLKELIIVDVNENSLTELIREINDLKFVFKLPKITPIVLDVKENFGNVLFRELNNVDLIWNFAANKHVRTQRNLISALHMLKVNLTGIANIIEFGSKFKNLESIFSISTDKASNPESIMGASKRIMEHILFSSDFQSKTSTRFANVLFSAGSLPLSWLTSISTNRPISYPVGVSRFFITPEESAQLCISAAVLGQSNKILVPKANEIGGLVDIGDLLNEFLNFFSKKPVYVDFESDVVRAQKSLKTNEVVVYRSKLDTLGDKTFEQFSDTSEVKVSLNEYLDSVEFRPLDQLRVDELTSYLKSDDISFDRLKMSIGNIFPSFNSSAPTENLDYRI